MAFEIQLEKLNYICGDQINGRVNLMATEQIKASHVYIKCFGIEKVDMVVKERRTRQATRWRHGRQEHYEEEYYVDVPCKQKVKPYNYGFKLYEFPDNVLNEGQYTIPFSFLLPENLPTSFEHIWTNNDGAFDARIQYYVKIYLIDTYNLKIVKTSKKFYIDQRPLDEGTLHGDFQQQTQRINSCCCCKRGEITTKAYTEKNGYNCGEQVWMIVECANRMSRPIREIVADFRKVIQVRAEGTSRS